MGLSARILRSNLNSSTDSLKLKMAAGVEVFLKKERSRLAGVPARAPTSPVFMAPS